MSTASDMRTAMSAIEVSERERDTSFARACLRVIEHFCVDLQRSGQIESYAIENSAEHDVSLLRLDIGGVPRRWQIRDDELRMGGIDGLREWLRRIVLREVRGIVQRGAASQHFQEQALDLRGPWARDEFVRFGEAHLDLLRQMYPARIDAQAERKAKDLFRAVAGQGAYDAVEAGIAWPVKGSAGGVYELLKRASFCIRRLKDGAELCAVVPGVPLYDHLLGIKLMIEHDEPRFIKTANVAGRINGGITWVPQDYDPRVGAAVREMVMDEAMRAVNPPLFLRGDPAL